MKTKMYYIGNLGILFLMFASSVFSQNITNTLGTNGVFTIKDAANTFFTLSSLSGEVNILRSLRLENTTNSTLGVLFKGTNRFLHNYGGGNTFLGINSGNFTMTGVYNLGVGPNSLFENSTGYFNTALGFASLNQNTIGHNNTALGHFSLYLNTTGYYNTALGLSSLYYNNTGSHNTALGYGSLYSNTTGFNNTAVGFEALKIADGFDNTALGFSTGSNVTSGSNLTLIGFNAQPTSGSAINQITLGNNFVSSLRCNVQTITSLSDARDKKNIQDLSLGLDFLMKVKPRLFNWDKREWYKDNTSDGSKMKEAPTAGFIAQELDEVQTNENAEWLNLVLKDNPEKLEATYGNLLPVMVKAIQELKVENEKLKVASLTARQENIELKNDNKIMKQSLLKLEQTQNKLASELKKLKLKESKITEVDN